MTRDEADAQLRQAIIDHANAYDMGIGDDLLNEYAIIAHWSRMVDDGNSPYTSHFHQDHIPTHCAIGLFQTALNHMFAGNF